MVDEGSSAKGGGRPPKNKKNKEKKRGLKGGEKKGGKGGVIYWVVTRSCTRMTSAFPVMVFTELVLVTADHQIR